MLFFIRLCAVLAAIWSVFPGLSFAETGVRKESLHVSTPLIHVRSEETGNLLTAEVFGKIGHPYLQVKEALTSPENWCEFAPLNLNVKACTAYPGDSGTILTLYIGRKTYQSPEATYIISYNFQVEESTADRFRVVMTAAKGPMGTRDYRMELTGEKAGKGTYFQFRSSYRESLRSRLATQGYLKTAGRHKVGFSIEGYSSDGEPRYVRGIKGVLERNAMRNYLALKAYLETGQLPPDVRFEERIRYWFALTELYPLQLHEIDREEYLETKRRERYHQEELQK